MAMPRTFEEPMCFAGEVVKVGMVNGQKQLAEAQRQANLQSRPLTQAEKEEIKRRRAANADRRRAALAEAERRAGTSSLQDRIAQRQAALKALAGKRADGGSALPATPDFAQPATPDFGHAPSTPPSLSEPEADEYRRKSRRITFSALTGALDDVSPEHLSEAASGIQAAQELAASVFAKDYTPRFSVAGKSFPPAHAQRGAKRSVDGETRNSVGLEAMTAKAKLLTGCCPRDSSSCSEASDDEDCDSQKGDLSLLATPGRFRPRSDGTADSDLWCTLGPKRSEASTLPPPPNRPPPQHPSKRMAVMECQP
eukprot:TRINITY_DN2988_c0_g2_i1.p1 TRINITY_DN2988_c0_g2~~TRINITY_DN2988_c0_g2_i1.p1  ORF type:complete len:324 (-),score=59.70 TRINITY_DN2988_c0_g2_i1:261-1193(-)